AGAAEDYFHKSNVAILASDSNFKVIYQNEKCRQLFNEVLDRTDYIGADLSECHKPETTEKVKEYFKEYEEKKRLLDYYVMDEPDNKTTVVNVPFYDGGEFAGVVEFIFESSLE
ncbi:PAS domain-containing protein, partial [Thermodesulfobacteriota bacterium]